MHNLKVALCAIAAYNEISYIEEWISYYRKLGISFFDIALDNWTYDNNSNDCRFINLGEYTSQYPRFQRQIDFYNEFIQNKYKDFDFVLFFDIDEFLVIKDGSVTISEFLEKYLEYNGIAVNWNMFGSKENECNSNSVIQRFTHCKRSLCDYYKSIINLRKSKNSIHFSWMHGPDQYDTIIDVTRKMFMNNDKSAETNSETINTAYLNHYFTKSKKEYKEKIERNYGWSYSLEKIKEQYLDMFSIYESNEYNEIEDLSALNMMKMV